MLVFLLVPFPIGHLVGAIMMNFGKTSNARLL
jgi:hypothetical protein